MKTCVRLVLTLILLIGINKTGYAQGLYEKVYSVEQIKSGGTFLIARTSNNVAMGKIIKKNDYTIADGIPIEKNTTNNIIYVGTVNTDSSPYEINIQPNNDYFYLKNIQGYLYNSTSTNIKYDEELTTNDKYKWNISIGNTENRFATISNVSTKRIINYISDSKDFRAASSTSSKANIQIFRKLSTYQSVPITISPVKYATLYYSDKNLIVPDGVEAYTYKYEDGLMISSKYKYMDIIPAGTAVVLHGNAGTYNFIETSLQGITDENNVLEGTDTTTDLENDDNYYFYMLSTNQDNDPASVGFYWGTANGRAFSNGANKAYLKIKKADAADAKPFFQFSDLADETTEINMTHAAPKHHDNSFYTLHGVKIDYPTEKGIYILNGKKIVK